MSILHHVNLNQMQVIRTGQETFHSLTAALFTVRFNTSVELRFSNNMSAVAPATSTAGLTRLLCGTSLFESVSQIENLRDAPSSVHYFSADKGEDDATVLRRIPRHLIPVCAADGAAPNAFLALFGLPGTAAGCPARLRDARVYQTLLVLRHQRGRLTASGLRADRDRVLLRPRALRSCRVRFLRPEDQHPRVAAPLVMTTASGQVAQPWDVQFHRTPGGAAYLAAHQTRSTELTAEHALAELMFVQTRAPDKRANESDQLSRDPAFVQVEPKNCEIKRFSPDLRTVAFLACFTNLLPPQDNGDGSSHSASDTKTSSMSSWESAGLSAYVTIGCLG